MSSKEIAVKFFDPEHGPGSTIVLYLDEEDAEKVLSIDDIQDPVELPSLPGRFHISEGSIGNFFQKSGSGGRNYSGDLREIISSIEDPKNLIEPE